MVLTENPFVRKLRNGAKLSQDDERVLRELIGPVQQIAAEQDIASVGERPYGLPLILSGWACRYRDLADGRRQIISFFLPGDLCEPFGSIPRLMDHSIGTLTAVTFAHVQAKAAREASRFSSGLERALWWDALTSSAFMQERTVSLGQRSAFERLAQLICELHFRLALVGLSDETGFNLPLRQTDLAHALGLSTVHLNRSLQALRRTGVVDVRSRRVTISDLEGLHDHALFDSSYFHLDGTELC